jgi:LmbE family N-acetylglucosaminyl deacetylase
MTKDTKKRVLILAAHPDDEILGCGGTAALHVRRGDHVTSVVACEGQSLRYRGHDIAMEEHTRAAAKALGVQDVRMLAMPDQRLDTMTLTEIITPIEAIVRETQPHIVYCQWGGDVNRDHHLLFEALLVATRPTEPCIEAVLAFDTASSTEWAYPRRFVPDTWIDVNETLTQKLDGGVRVRAQGVLQLNPRQRHFCAQKHPQPFGRGLRRGDAIFTGKDGLADTTGNAVDTPPHAAASDNVDIGRDKGCGLDKGTGDRMLTVLLQRGCHCQAVTGTDACQRHYCLHTQRRFGQGAGLVEGDSRRPGRAFQESTIADEHAVATQRRRSHGNGHWRCQGQRTGAGHHEHCQRNHPVVCRAGQKPEHPGTG